ncbi:PstS family phosphate ABC transporter substrate-binding protein [Methanosarcina sp. T3]|uniref:PstS family phosphate ABC transporter substrate-binding protein n=1 Tax=Methanosarcina sp. T3 TaxID=3439062 RepID=UPI003F824B87
MVFKNDKAVSPVVATLVLVVVAIIGAAAVGALLGAFSSDVSSEASAGETSSASSSELLIGGSTTVQPVSELLADAFMTSHKGVKVTVQGGGSGAGVAGCEQGVLDIGSSSDYAKVDPASHPDIEIFEIGGSGVVLIGKGFATIPDNVSVADVKTAYESGTLGGVTVTAYQRSEASGTEDTFSEYISGNSSKTFIDGTSAKGASGNAGVYAAVKAATTPTIGFVDYGFVKDGDGVTAIGITCANSDVTPKNIQKSLKIKAGASTETPVFPTGLCRNLYYCTLGTPSAAEKSFIDFAMSPAAIDYFHDAGYYSIYDYKF